MKNTFSRYQNARAFSMSPAAQSTRVVHLVRACLLVFVCTIILATLQTAKAQDNGTTAPEGLSIERRTFLAQIATNFRTVGIRDVNRINELFAPNDLSPFPAKIMDEDADYNTDLWSLFFKQTQSYVGNGNSSSPIIGFYNPFTDYWLLTKWAVFDGKYALDSTGFYAGSHLRNPKRRNAGDIEQAPDWLKALSASSTDTPISLKDALQEISAMSVVTFLAQFPLASSEDAPLPQIGLSAALNHAVLARRTKTFFLQNVELATNPDLREVYLATLTAVSNENKQQLSDLTKSSDVVENFNSIADSIPPEIRTNLQPLAVLNSDKITLVLSGNTTNARWLTVTMFEPDGDEWSGSLSSLSVYDLYYRVHEQ